MNGVASARILYVLLPYGSLHVFLVCFSIYVRCKNTEKVTRKMKFFFNFFGGGLVFNGMEMAFLYRLRPLARDNALGRTQASGNGTKEMVWNALARDEGGRDGIAGT